MLRSLWLLAAILLVAPAAQAQDAGAGEPVRLENVPTYSGGMMGGSGPFTLLSLRDGRIVVAPDAMGEARADSASGEWDLGLRGTEVIINGGTSGPGGRRGLLAESAYDDVAALPGSLSTDGEGTCPSGPPRVVCHGSGNGWYTYGGGGVLPIATRTLVIVREDGSAVKVRFLSYTLGGALPNGARPRYVTLEATPLPTD